MKISEEKGFCTAWENVQRQLSTLLTYSHYKDHAVLDDRRDWWMQYADTSIALSDIAVLAKKQMGKEQIGKTQV